MKKTPTSKSFNVVIVPTREIKKEAISVSNDIKSKDRFFILGPKRNVPHITIYMIDFPIKNIPTVKKRLKKLSGQIKHLKLTALRYRQNADGFIDVSYRKSQGVQDLQKKVVKILNPLREGLIRKKDRQRMNGFDARLQTNIRRYGYRSIGKDYFPHLTLTRLQSTKKKVISTIPKKDFSFNAVTIGLFHLGQHGTCQKRIALFDIK